MRTTKPIKTVLIAALVTMLLFSISTRAELVVPAHSFNIYVNPELENTYNDESMAVFAPEFNRIESLRSVKSLTKKTFYSSKISPFSKTAIKLKGLSDESIKAAVVSGKVLNYPNPFKLEEGTEIGYELSKDLDVELQIYNLLGHRVFERKYEKSTEGGKKGENLISISSFDIGRLNMPASAYIYYIINNGKILGKGKMAVLP